MAVAFRNLDLNIYQLPPAHEAIRSVHGWMKCLKRDQASATGDCIGREIVPEKAMVKNAEQKKTTIKTGATKARMLEFNYRSMARFQLYIVG